MTTGAPSNDITTGVSLLGAFASEQALDTRAQDIQDLGAKMNGESYGNDQNRDFVMGRHI